jgi:hypothetical protein
MLDIGTGSQAAGAGLIIDRLGVTAIMYTKEFEESVFRTETDSTLTLDVRPFGDRQGEAIDSYLHDLGMAVLMNISRPAKSIALVCDSETVFPRTTGMWLTNMRAQGVTIEIQPEYIVANAED